MAVSEGYELIGPRIRQRRQELDLTLQEVSMEVGVAASTIQRYEKARFSKIKLPVIEAIAAALKVNPAWLIGNTDDPTDYEDPELIASIPRSYITACGGNIKQAYQAMQAATADFLHEISVESQSGRTGAKEEMFRLFGTEHTAADLRLVSDKTAILYYKALDRQCAPELLELIGAVDEMGHADLENIRILVQAYLRADAPIREIVDTALKPYRKDVSLDEEIG